MSEGLRALTSRRLLIVTGKGGTGKTTLAAALGLLAARHGTDTAVIEVGDTAELPRLFGQRASQASHAAREPERVRPHLSTLQLIPEVALQEYLELQLRLRRPIQMVLSNPGFRRLLDAAPGWRALITLGKLWHLQSQTREGRSRWPLLVVDAPSTGHGLAFLSVPNVVLETVRLGPLRNHTESVQQLLTDGERTLVLPVTLAEELPVSETLELWARVRELGLSIGPLFANAVESSPQIEDLDGVLSRLERAQPPPEFATLLEPDCVRACVEHRTRRAALHRMFLDRLERELGYPPIELPYLPSGVDDPVGLERLADELEARLAQWKPHAERSL